MPNTFTATDRIRMEERRTAKEIYRDNCPHEKWTLHQFPGGQWSKRCDDLQCLHFFESDSANSDILKNEIEL